MRKKLMLAAMIASIFALAGISAGAEDASGEKVVKDGSVVKLHYTLTVDGDKVDSSEGKEPLEFTVGRNQVVPGFEKGVMGLRKGDKKSFKVSPEEGYGPEDPEAFQEVPRDRLPAGIELKEGMTLGAQGPEGQFRPVTISKLKETTVVINFNHPLAGKTLNFDVEVVEIQ